MKAQNIQTIRGFRDILPQQIRTWQKIEQEAASLFQAFGYEEIRLPVIEKTALFARSIGDTTDIVEKEMYSFEDRNSDKLTLRPEATASICRSYIQHKMYAADPVKKFFTMGPMFRRERPQKGRYRQFYQIDAEAFGIASPYMDAEMIFLLHTLFERLGLADLQVHINSLGCARCRPEFQKALMDFIADNRAEFCDTCTRRMGKNPLRILDCKVESCRNALEGAPATVDCLCRECKEHFDQVQTALSKQKVSCHVDNTLVRGLDYYTRTAWEIQTTSLGAQSAVAGGGRYDGLVEELGGPPTPAIGFAIGFDRLVEIMEDIQEDSGPETTDLFIAALGEAAMGNAYHLACDLNQAGIRTESDFRGKSMKSLMKRANKINARYVLMIGENEIQNGAAILRDMDTKEQVSIGMDTLAQEIRNKIR